MRKNLKLISTVLLVVILITTLIPSAFAKDFAPSINATNLGVQTQYAYTNNDPSWLRKLVLKEDMLSIEGIATELELFPVAKYPYIIDARGFQAQVDESVVTYTLDEDAQKAAYIYLLKQLGALTIISEPTATNETKADWLRKHGIIVTEEDEKDPEKVLMISALYALMRNDLYYVLKGEHLEIPKNTPLEKALVFYLSSLSGQSNALTEFLKKFFGKVEIGSLDDYIFYTSLLALYTNGYVSPKEIPTISRKEVYRRMAIMSIRNYGIAIDGDKATTEEIQQKYLTAMLGTQYRVSLDPSSLMRAQKHQGIAYYILQRMAREDANLTISNTRYSFQECFNLVCKKTTRFNLKNEFYSDIHEYNVYLKTVRDKISINPTPISKAAQVTINGQKLATNGYTAVEIKSDAKQTLTIVSRCKLKDKIETSIYKLNIHQGSTPAPDNSSGSTNNITLPVPTVPTGPIISNPPELVPIITQVNGVASELLDGVLSLNDKGQLVDKNGNIISQTQYEPLPDGYKYVMGDDGIIQIVLVDAVTEPTQDELTDNKINPNKVLSILFIVLGVLFIVALVVTIIILTRRSKMSDSEKMKKRKAKEKKKKQKDAEKKVKKQRKK